MNKIAKLFATSITVFSMFVPTALAEVPGFRHFIDVPMSHQYANEIDALADLGIVKGSNGYFFPENLVTRAEFTAIIIRSKYSQAEINNCIMHNVPTGYIFPDVPIDNTFSGEICMAKLHNVVSGYSDGLFHPEVTVTMKQAAKIAVITYKIDVNEGNVVDPNAALENYYVSLEKFGYIPPTVATRGDVMTDIDLKRKETAFVIFKGYKHNATVQHVAWKATQLNATRPGATAEVSSYSTFQIPGIDQVHEALWLGDKGYVRTRPLYGNYETGDQNTWNIIDKETLRKYFRLNEATNFKIIAQSETILGGNEVLQGVWISIQNSDGTYSDPKGYVRYLPYNPVNGSINWDVEFTGPFKLSDAMANAPEIGTTYTISGQSAVFFEGVSTADFNSKFEKNINYSIDGVFEQDIVIVRQYNSQVVYRQYIPVKSSDNRPDYSNSTGWTKINIDQFGVKGPNTIPAPGEYKEYDKYVVPLYNESGKYGVLVETFWSGKVRYMRNSNMGSDGLPVRLWS